jgi:hypothetical protein
MPASYADPSGVVALSFQHLRCRPSNRDACRRTRWCDDCDSFPQKVRQTDTASLTELASRRLPPHRMVIVVVGNREAIAESIRRWTSAPWRIRTRTATS